jgi:hypothetical protein
MKRIKIDESELRKVIKKYISEQLVSKPGEEKTLATKQRCVAGNVIPIEDIVGPSKEFQNYTSNLTKRDGGINGMVDALDMLKTLRLHPDIKDGGEHLSYSLMNHLNKYRNKNYFEGLKNILKDVLF